MPLSPENAFKQFWNISLFIMLTMTAIITPIRVCIIDDKDTNDWSSIDMTFNVYFGVDILINFLSAYSDEKNLIIYCFKSIIYNYLTGWFLIDFVSIFPVEIISTSDTSYNKLFRLLRIPRLYKLASLIKVSKSMQSNPLFIEVAETF